jgi:hypothetical protein
MADHYGLASFSGADAALCATSFRDVAITCQAPIISGGLFVNLTTQLAYFLPFKTGFEANKFFTKRKTLAGALGLRSALLWSEIPYERRTIRNVDILYRFSLKIFTGEDRCVALCRDFFRFSYRQIMNRDYDIGFFPYTIHAVICLDCVQT